MTITIRSNGNHLIHFRYTLQAHALGSEPQLCVLQLRRQHASRDAHKLPLQRGVDLVTGDLRHLHQHLVQRLLHCNAAALVPPKEREGEEEEHDAKAGAAQRVFDSATVALVSGLCVSVLPAVAVHWRREGIGDSPGLHS